MVPRAYLHNTIQRVIPIGRVVTIIGVLEGLAFLRMIMPQGRVLAQ